MDVFINGIITIKVDDKHWIDHAKSAALLVIHTLLRPLQLSEPLKRDDPLSLRKLAGEGQLADQKICLNQYINTQSLRVSLPEQKQTAWTNDIKRSISFYKNLHIYFGIINWKAQSCSTCHPASKILLNCLHHLLNGGYHRGSNYGIDKISNCGLNSSNM